MIAMLKHQQFVDGESDEKVQKVLKHQCLGIHDDQKKQNFDKY